MNPPNRVAMPEALFDAIRAVSVEKSTVSLILIRLSINMLRSVENDVPVRVVVHVARS